MRAIASRLPIALRAAAGHRDRAALRGESDRTVGCTPAAERERQARGEGVAGAVGVDERPREIDRVEGLLLAGDDIRATLAPHRGDDHVRLRIEQAGLVRLARVASAADERIELDLRLDERRKLPRGRDEGPRLPR